jgi:hypothetical protein
MKVDTALASLKGKSKGERMLEELRKGRKNIPQLIEEINTDDEAPTPVESPT